MKAVVGRRYRILGKVQGVGYRWWVVRSAGESGLRGWVRNLSDGAVEVEAWGSLPALSRLERQLGVGPTGAVVTELEMETLEGGAPGDRFVVLD